MQKPRASRCCVWRLSEEERAALHFAWRTLDARCPVFDINGSRETYQLAMRTIDKLLIHDDTTHDEQEVRDAPT